MRNTAETYDFNDIQALKQLLVERDSALLLNIKNISDKEKVIADNKKFITEKDIKITRLEQTIAHLQLKYFGRSSERHISPDQPSLFNEAEQLEAVEAPVELDENTAEESTVIADDDSADKKIVARKPGRIKFPAAWPRVKVFHDLDAHEKTAPVVVR